MKTLTVLVCVAIFSASYAQDEWKKANIMKFYKCLACTKDELFKEAYMKCEELRPPTCKEIVNDCKLRLMPEAITLQDRWDRACTDSYEENEKLYECIMTDERRKNFSEFENSLQEEFTKCLKSIDKKFCDEG